MFPRVLSMTAVTLLLIFYSDVTLAEDRFCTADMTEWPRNGSDSFPDCNRNGAFDVCDVRLLEMSFERQTLNANLLQDNPANLACQSTFSDIDNDTVPDLISCSSSESGLHLVVASSTAAPAFSTPQQYDLTGAAGSIVALRGRVGRDIFVFSPTSSRYFENDGSGNFSSEAPVEPVINGVQFAGIDVNHDDFEDLLALEQESDDRYSLALYRRQSSSSFIKAQTIVSGIATRPEFWFIAGRLFLHNPSETGAVLYSYILNPSGVFEQTAAWNLPQFTGDSYRLFVGNFRGAPATDLLFLNHPASAPTQASLYQDVALDQLPTPVIMGIAGANISGTLDADGDGKLELTRVYQTEVSSRFGSSDLQIFYNDGSNAFRRSGSVYYTGYFYDQLNGSGHSSVLATADYDFTQDGLPDRLALYAYTGSTGWSSASSSGTYALVLLQQTTGYPLTSVEADANGNDIPDSCEEGDLNTFLYSLWNGFSSLVNILELTNTGDQNATARVRLRDISGSVFATIDIPIAATGSMI